MLKTASTTMIIDGRIIALLCPPKPTNATRELISIGYFVGNKSLHPYDYEIRRINPKNSSSRRVAILPQAGVSNSMTHRVVSALFGPPQSLMFTVWAELQLENGENYFRASVFNLNTNQMLLANFTFVCPHFIMNCLETA